MAGRRLPSEIASSAELTVSQKVAMLRDWDTQLRLMMVADEENMLGPVPRVTLGEVDAALAKLGLTRDAWAGPTKQG